MMTKDTFQRRAQELFQQTNHKEPEKRIRCEQLNIPSDPEKMTEDDYKILIRHLEMLVAIEEGSEGKWVLGIWIPKTSKSK